MDDLPGGQVKMPPGISGRPQDTSVIEAYARLFLQSAVNHGVRVIGITPHSPRVGSSQETSAVWQIVEEWNSGIDEDGVPFREKIYAVFPGFEPSLNNGRSGLHLIFLFDPEIGRINYLKAFDNVMNSVSPWSDNQLRMSGKSAKEAFQSLREFQARECLKAPDGSFHWSYIVLAPHIEGDKGLLGAQKAQVLQFFQHNEVSALELGDHKLPVDTVADRPWLREGMAAHRQAFLHGSDAYSIEEIGRRHTWVKLASPRIEGLRQAFIASDSRVRIGYRREGNGDLKEVPDPPDVTMNQRPWLKSVKISGKASFFGNNNEVNQGRCFDFSPDLTCVIGGSMTGKSTLLDGLRVHVDAPLPKDKSAREQVEARGKHRFLSGSAEVVLDCPGRDPTAAPHEKWPAVFYTQAELQRLAQDPDAVEDILAKLLASETQDIAARENRLSEIDEELTHVASNLAKLSDDVAEAEQASQRSQKAAEELEAFSEVGVENLSRVASGLNRWRDSAKGVSEVASKVDSLLESSLAGVEFPDIDDDLASKLKAAGIEKGQMDIHASWARVRGLLKSAKDELSDADALIKSIADVLKDYENTVRVQVNRDLANRGFDGAKISQSQELAKQASLLESNQANLDKKRDAFRHEENRFETLCQERKNFVERQRCAFDRVIEAIHSQFEGRIGARRIDEGRKDTLAYFLKELHQRGITRWWNDLTDDQRPTPERLQAALETNQLEALEMTPVVQKTFIEQLTPLKQRELAALRCRDDYVLEFLMDDGSYRPLRDLSGGQRVNLLLSLLLETNDERPLVIDQPEDELDNRFLFKTMLPALKRLKGRRQIIVATHDANIVVNGDADQVIQLDATADRGHIVCSGAIEEPAVRDAIVQTVDGGDEAFRLRRLKYGF
ncbi:MAG: AAA family ATPase [Gammaproteobacteria bacterium]|nr:AAA family ATPase [Gammaproteobacteria bacterium]